MTVRRRRKNPKAYIISSIFLLTSQALFLSSVTYPFRQKTEDEQIEDQFKELFPNFHDQDFPDMQDANIQLDLTDKPFTLTDTITLEDVKFVCEVHAKVVQNCTRSEWLSPPSKGNGVELDFVTPLVQKYKLFRALLEKYNNCLEYTLDAELVGSLNVLVHVARNSGSTSGLCKYTANVDY